MKSFPKRLTRGVTIVIANILLAFGLFELAGGIIENLQDVGISSDKIQHLTLLIFCAVQISINILLYKKFLKKFLEPAEQKKPALYLLLPVISCVIWIIMLYVSMFAGYSFSIETDIQLFLGFLPIVLSVLIPISIAYYLYFYKYVGEAYFAYILSVFFIMVIPTTLLITYSH